MAYQLVDILEFPNTNLASGKAYFYTAGTTNAKDVYSTPSGTVIDQTSGIALAADGTYNGDIYADGTYDVYLYKADSTLWARLNSIQFLAASSSTTNAANVTSTISSIALTSIFESDKTTVKAATNASNVTTSLNGVALTSIFESDKTTVKQYTPAVGTVLQVQSTQISDAVNVNAAIPLDDTIPQNTEGVEIATVTITPSSASNKLQIEGWAWGCLVNVGGTRPTLAIFQDTTANSLAAEVGSETYVTGQYGWCRVTHTMTAGTTSATTFKVRGGAAAGSWKVNGNSSGTRLFGGVASSGIRVTEIKA